MKIPNKIKIAVENRLSAIKSAEFSQDTIKLLLIEIREYLSKDSALKEIAHFIAHPERDRGLILETVNYAYNRSRVLFRQLEGNKSGKGLELDITNLPIDIYDTVTWHFSHIKPNNSKLLRFKRTFVFDKKNNVYRPKKQITQNIIKYIQEAIGVLSLQPALSQTDIIKEIVTTIKRIGLSDYSESIIKEQNAIMVCILSMLHQSSFILKDGKTAEAYLSNEPIVIDMDGKVYLAASVRTELSPVSISFTLISSEVTIKESFSKSMINMDSGFPRIDYTRFDHIEAVRNSEGKMVFVKYAGRAEQGAPPDRYSAGAP